MSWPERVWYGDSIGAVLARAVLAPPSWLYCASAVLRDRLYDAGVLPSVDPVLPALAVGNLSVGGTGKTPVAAWATRRLLSHGARPAIVLRGYGADEPLVHQRLNPDALVIVGADRVRAVQLARAQGADCVVLDDAYQHRRIRRRENWLLVAAERWEPVQRCLPAGPLREPATGMARATLIVVTRKSAAHETAQRIAKQLASATAGTPLAIVHLVPNAIVNVRDGTTQSVHALRRARVMAVAAVGAPDAFFAQLRSAGAIVVHEAAFRDHRAYDAGDVAELVRRGREYDMVVCTLKDAVKLAPLWPREGPGLWYVSQGVEVEYGETALDTSLNTILAARASVPPTAGPAGPDSHDHGYRSSTADQ
ncbi:MAG TPA: tetraacyldisaccharide 4'-kinase [Gemmatimonadaceae bacterium]|nr:tetraacyldisaccharide 4'-kinase [Gemmatimonadaceae bacterium]